MNASKLNEQDIYNEEEIIRDATAFSGTLYLTQGLYIIRGFIIARLLSPSFYGIWSVLRIFFRSATYLGLGTQQAMLREVPFSVGEGNKERKSVLVQTSLSWNILISSIVMMLVFIFSFTGFAEGYRTELRLSGILFLLNSVHLFMRPKFKSEQKIILLSRYLFVYAVFNTAFGITLLFFLRLNGLLLGMIIAQLLLLTYLVIKGQLSLQLYIDKNILNELFRIGLPIMILWFLTFLIGNVDKFIVFIWLGKTNAGYYGLAAFVTSMVSYISYTISTVIFP
ncbi:MAG: oligosaccharide flippase family protein, partial [Ignavibacteriaceae bacterium]